jgi:hypothetical protein
MTGELRVWSREFRVRGLEVDRPQVKRWDCWRWDTRGVGLVPSIQFDFVPLFPIFAEDLFEVLFVVCLLEVRDGGDGTVDGVVDDLFDPCGALGFGFFLGAGEVAAGDLQAVEEQTGALGVEVVGGQAAQDAGDGELDGGAVFELSYFEGGLSGAAGFLRSSPLGEVFHRAAILVVKIAEIFLFECGRAAAMACGEDVAALETYFGRSGHARGYPWPYSGKIFKILELRVDLEGDRSQANSRASDLYL